jgi:carbamate kinase
MRYVIALGGNAIKDRSSIRASARSIARLYKAGHGIVVTHGNGPQVGELAITQNESLAVLTAQTQAWIGVKIEQSISVALAEVGVKRGYSIPQVVLTKVIVDSRDRAFSNPSKPIGRFYDWRHAKQLSKDGFTVKKLIGGYRRVVPSPIPREIIQKDLIEGLLDGGKIAIACGGGGMPMFRTANGLKFAEAVIDKDMASSLIAREIKADAFLILTNVDGVYLNFKSKNQRFLRQVRAKELKEYLNDGCFEDGSMAPKIRACIDFVEATGKAAGIGSISYPDDVIRDRKLTSVIP